MPAAGTLDRRLRVERNTATGVDDLNAPVLTWTEVVTVWAAKVAKSEAETFDEKTGQRYASRLVAFRTHFFSGLLETDRLVSDGITFDIRGIRELGFRQGLEITAEAQP